MADVTMARPRPRVPRGTLIGGAVALVALLLLVPMILFLAVRPAAVGGGIKVSVVVANKDIPIRTTIQQGDLTMREMLAEDVPPQAFTKVSDVKGLVAAANLVKGQAITQNLVAKNAEQIGEADIAYLPIPTGYVALTIPADEQRAVAGYIRPGDYVTVIGSMQVEYWQQTPQGLKQYTVTEADTIFTNLHVIRVGQAAQQRSQSASGSTPAQASSVTVVMTQCQAEIMQWFLLNAPNLKYTLESYKDYAPHDQVDQSCPDVNSAKGIVRGDIQRLYPRLFQV